MLDAEERKPVSEGTNLQHGLVVGCGRSSHPESELAGVPLDVLGDAQLRRLTSQKQTGIRQKLAGEDLPKFSLKGEPSDLHDCFTLKFEFELHV